VVDKHEPEALTLAEANSVVGDDIAYWVDNPFMPPELVVEKVCWWVTRAMQAPRLADPTGSSEPVASADRTRQVHDLVQQLADQLAPCSCTQGSISCSRGHHSSTPTSRST